MFAIKMLMLAQNWSELFRIGSNFGHIFETLSNHILTIKAVSIFTKVMYLLFEQNMQTSNNIQPSSHWAIQLINSECQINDSLNTFDKFRQLERF